MNKLNNEVDSPEMIQYCLECPWKKCWDCLGQKNDYAYALRLELDESHPMGVKISARQGVELLPHGADRRIAHVVMETSEPHINDCLPLVVRHHQIISVHAEKLRQQLHVSRKDIRRYYRI